MQLFAGANLIDVDFGLDKNLALFSRARKRQFRFISFHILALRRTNLWCYVSG